MFGLGGQEIVVILVMFFVALAAIGGVVYTAVKLGRR